MFPGGDNMGPWLPSVMSLATARSLDQVNSAVDMLMVARREAPNSSTWPWPPPEAVPSAIIACAMNLSGMVPASSQSPCWKTLERLVKEGKALFEINRCVPMHVSTQASKRVGTMILSEVSSILKPSAQAIAGLGANEQKIIACFKVLELCLLYQDVPVGADALQTFFNPGQGVDVHSSWTIRHAVLPAVQCLEVKDCSPNVISAAANYLSSLADWSMALEGTTRSVAPGVVSAVWRTMNAGTWSQTQVVCALLDCLGSFIVSINDFDSDGNMESTETISRNGLRDLQAMLAKPNSQFSIPELESTTLNSRTDSSQLVSRIGKVVLDACKHFTSDKRSAVRLSLASMLGQCIYRCQRLLTIHCKDPFLSLIALCNDESSMVCKKASAAAKQFASDTLVQLLQESFHDSIVGMRAAHRNQVDLAAKTTSSRLLAGMISTLAESDAKTPGRNEDQHKLDISPQRALLLRRLPDILSTLCFCASPADVDAPGAPVPVKGFPAWLSVPRTSRLYIEDTRDQPAHAALLSTVQTLVHCMSLVTCASGISALDTDCWHGSGACYILACVLDASNCENCCALDTKLIQELGDRAAKVIAQSSAREHQGLGCDAAMAIQRLYSILPQLDPKSSLARPQCLRAWLLSICERAAVGKGDSRLASASCLGMLAIHDYPEWADERADGLENLLGRVLSDNMDILMDTLTSKVHRWTHNIKSDEYDVTSLAVKHCSQVLAWALPLASKHIQSEQGQSISPAKNAADAAVVFTTELSSLLAGVVSDLMQSSSKPSGWEEVVASLSHAVGVATCTLLGLCPRRKVSPSDIHGTRLLRLHAWTSEDVKEVGEHGWWGWQKKQDDIEMEALPEGDVDAEKPARANACALNVAETLIRLSRDSSPDISSAAMNALGDLLPSLHSTTPLDSIRPLVVQTWMACRDRVSSNEPNVATSAASCISQIASIEPDVIRRRVEEEAWPDVHSGLLSKRGEAASCAEHLLESCPSLKGSAVSACWASQRSPRAAKPAWRRNSSSLMQRCVKGCGEGCDEAWMVHTLQQNRRKQAAAAPSLWDLAAAAGSMCQSQLGC